MIINETTILILFIICINLEALKKTFSYTLNLSITIKKFADSISTNPFICPLCLNIVFILIAFICKYFGQSLKLTLGITVFSSICYFYFIVLAFEHIDNLNKKNLTLKQSIIRIIFSVLWAIVFFGILYTIIFIGIPNSFEGPIGEDVISQFISFQYFSFMTFSLGSYGEIFPIHNLARLAVIFQVIYHFIIIVFLVGNFSNIRNLLKKNSPYI